MIEPNLGTPWLILIVALFLYELFTLRESLFGRKEVKNNTLSHWVVSAMKKHRWLRIAIPTLIILTLGHWVAGVWPWLNTWWPWPAPVWVP